MAALRKQGASEALNLQNRASNLTVTELNAEDNHIPEFQISKSVKNMLYRQIGFICKSSAGRVVRLLQNYDSDIYKGEPENLPAQWGFVWSKDPAKAKPFIAISTSPYMIDECCSENDIVYKSKIDNNVWAPSAYPAGWISVETEDE